MADSDQPRAAGSYPDRREAERLSVLGSLSGEVMLFQPLTIFGISERGLEAETNFPLYLDSLHKFRLKLGDQPVIVKGRITHCSLVDVDQELVRYRSGVQFVDLPQHVIEALTVFVAKLKKSGERRD
jgi:PilZ domain